MDIKFKDFEEALDLLLAVSKYQMDIYEVPLIEVIEQYLAYLATLQAMRLGWLLLVLLCDFRMISNISQFSLVFKI